MKNTFGTNLTVTLFGESHGREIGAVLDGLAPGIPVDEHYIADRLRMRRPFGKISTARREEDRFRIVSGLFAGKTCGTPLCILIPNRDIRSGDYDRTHTLARPGHADFTANEKYRGFQDYRGGGHFSGRLTAALTAAGAVLMPALEKRGIRIGTHIARCAGIADRAFSEDPEILAQELAALNQKQFAVLDDQAGQAMVRGIEDAAAAGDSVGGLLETAACGLPAGLGEPWFDSVESCLSHAMFSIPAVKGLEFGAGFGFADMRGSGANDAFCKKDGKVVTATNHNGGINGGITNGMPVVFRTVIKPTPSISVTQETVDLETGSEARLTLKGRHDPAIVHRARIVQDAVTALVLADLLAGRYGTDWLG